MAVRKKDRFEVFKRDSFTCQYCGKSAPDIVLNLDHIQPVSKGGSEDITNLITSCWDCNIGKGARELSDDTVIKKQQAQLRQLQERREQLEMMMEWQRSLMDMEQDIFEDLITLWDELTPGRMLNKLGQQGIRKLTNEYNYLEIAAAMRIAATQYLEFDDDENATADSASISINKLRGVCYVRKQQKDDPYIKDLFYIRGILRKRFEYCSEYKALKWLRDALDNGCSIAYLKDMAKHACHWSEWKTWMSDYADVDNG